MVGLARDSLIIKRKVLERFTENDLYPYVKFYLRGIKEGTGLYWKNHFSTIGLIGMNEACLNFLGQDLTTEQGQLFALRVMDFLRDRVKFVLVWSSMPSLFNGLCAQPRKDMSSCTSTVSYPVVQRKLPVLLSRNTMASTAFLSHSGRIPKGSYQPGSRTPALRGRARAY
jgi:hypothetical protein